eukprot:2718186-Lingulodinium_polyedra.AAC.1
MARAMLLLSILRPAAHLGQHNGLGLLPPSAPSQSWVGTTRQSAFYIFLRSSVTLRRNPRAWPGLE